MCILLQVVPDPDGKKGGAEGASLVEVRCFGVLAELCCAVLCWPVLCCAVLAGAVLCCAVLCCSTLCLLHWVLALAGMSC